MTARKPAGPAPADGGPYASADLLLKSTLGDTTDVELPSGLIVRVRGLNRAEIRGAGLRAKGDEALAEQFMIKLALVQPELTLPQVKQWYATAPAGDTTAVVDALQALSISDRPAKEWTKSLPRESGTEPGGG